MQILSTIPPYADPELEQEFKAFESSIRSYARLQAQADASRNLPSSPEEFEVLIARHLRSQTQLFIHRCASKLQSLAGMDAATKLEQSCQAKTAPLDSQLTNTRIEAATLEEQRKQLELVRSSTLIRIIGHSGLCLMGIGEGILSYNAFRYIGQTTPTAATLSASVCVLIIFGCLLGGAWIHKGSTTRQRIARFAMVAFPFILGFFELARLRVQGFQMAALGFHETGEMPFSAALGVAIPLFVFSSLLFCTGLWGAAALHRTKAQREIDKQHDQVVRELERLRTKRSRFSARITAVEQETFITGLKSRQRHEYEIAWLERATAAANEGQNDYMDHNARARGMVPEFFCQVQPLRFTLFPNQQNHAA